MSIATLETLSALKWAHVSFAVLSGTLFATHGVLMLRESPLRKTVWFRVLPHGVDTLLLTSAVLLAWATGQAPWVLGWLGVKVGLVVVYILCGAIALKRGPTRRIRAVFFGVSLAIYLQIVSIAVTRNPLGLLAIF